MRRVVVLICFCVSARSQSPDASVMQALLSEVHQLRVALEHSNTIAPRIQLAVERLKLQQEVVVRLSKQLEDVQQEFAHEQSSRESQLEQVKLFERKINETVDPVERKKMDEEMSAFQAHAHGGQKMLESLQTREADLTSRLRSEQATLDGLNDRLNQIEREFTAPHQP
jgi:chromosome segregation ATPase